MIETRSKAPLLPMRIFRLRTLAASNASGFLMGTAIFSMFFLLTLYMQQVLHYSALKTGVAYIALTVTIVSFSAVSQALVTRLGIRRVLPPGSRCRPARCVLFARLPVHGHYWTDLLPAFLLSGVGLALAFVPMSIGGLTGVRPADAGIASGLINTTSRSAERSASPSRPPSPPHTRTTSSTAHPGSTPAERRRVDAGFQIAFYVLAAIGAARRAARRADDRVDAGRAGGHERPGRGVRARARHLTNTASPADQLSCPSREALCVARCSANNCASNPPPCSHQVNLTQPRHPPRRTFALWR